MEHEKPHLTVVKENEALDAANEVFDDDGESSPHWGLRVLVILIGVAAGIVGSLLITYHHSLLHWTAALICWGTSVQLCVWGLRARS